MDNLNDIKQIWMSADVDALPKADEVLRTIRQYRLKQVVKAVALLVTCLLLLATMVWVLFDYKSHMLVTRIGEAFMIGAIFMMLAISYRSLIRLSTGKNFNNDQFLSYLKEEQLRCIAFQKRTQRIGFAMATSGLALYIFEMASKNLLRMLAVYLALAIYFVFVWRVIRPRAMGRKAAKLDETIKKLEKLSIQFKQ